MPIAMKCNFFKSSEENVLDQSCSLLFFPFFFSYFPPFVVRDLTKILSLDASPSPFFFFENSKEMTILSLSGFWAHLSNSVKQTKQR